MTVFCINSIRTLINEYTGQGLQKQIMPTHTENRILPYSAIQMFDLVADIESYPQFLPWNSAARIRSRKKVHNGPEIIKADLIVSFKVFRERFTSQALLWRDYLKIETEYLDGPFKHMKAKWCFSPAKPPASQPQTKEACEVNFFVDFEFKNKILQGVIGMVFNDAMHRIVRAFEQRAEALYCDHSPEYMVEKMRLKGRSG